MVLLAREPRPGNRGGCVNNFPLTELQSAPLFAHARGTDPATSHEAARKVESSGAARFNRTKCLNAVRDNPGRTAAEIAVLCGLERHEPSLRLPELREAGLVANGAARYCNVNKGRAMTWWIVEVRA